MLPPLHTCLTAFALTAVVHALLLLLLLTLLRSPLLSLCCAVLCAAAVAVASSSCGTHWLTAERALKLNNLLMDTGCGLAVVHSIQTVCGAGS